MERIEEFWYCVASQEDLPLYKGKEDKRNPCKDLINFIEDYKKAILDGSEKKAAIINAILEKPAVISDIRVLVGVSDKRLYLDLTYLANIYVTPDGRRLVAEKREHLLKHDTKFFVNLLNDSELKHEFAIEITDYFIEKGLLDILNTFITLQKEQIIQIFNNLIAPKEIQQMQAKYRGHGAEQAFAKIVKECGLDIYPPEKDIDPMAGYDPNVDLSNMNIVQRDANDDNCHSFDLIVKKNNKVKVLIQSLIHSSDPGQYGVNKSDETKFIYERIKEFNELNSSDVVYLLGSVDGVGFCENPNGTLVKMLGVFDDFFQMHTLFKIPLFFQKIGLITNVVGIAFDKKYFGKFGIQYFEEKYLLPIGVKNLTGEDLTQYRVLEAGKAKVAFKQ